MPNVRAFQWTLMIAAFLIAAVASDGVMEDNANNLTCYNCYEFQNHCHSLANKSAVKCKRCAEEESFCKVERLHLKEGLLTFERSCSSICVPGCETAGEYMRCSSCCTKHLCNVDNAASLTLKNGHATTVIAGCTIIYGYLAART